MPYYRYLIVGGGMTADAAVSGIRETDRADAIGIISAEYDPPYDRPPLSKGLWKGEPFAKIWRGTAALGVDLHLGRTAVSLDPEYHRVVDSRGTEFTYGKLLLATGGTPRRFPFGGRRIIYFRTVEDYRRLRGRTGLGGRFAVIGGGFIGSEIAAALAMTGNEVVMIFPGEGICSHVFPADLSLFLNGHFRGKGVDVRAGETVTGLEVRQERVALRVHSARESKDREMTVDEVVAGIGILPDDRLARAAGLAVENGIVVDETLRTSHPDIFAAGDVAAFPSPALGKRIRAEHEDNADAMGRAAGRAMAGHPEPYRHLPFFYSDLFDLGYEAVGETDPRLETAADWSEPYRKGTVYYLREGRVRGVLLWDVWHQVEAARELIADPGPFRPEVLMGRLPKAA